MEYEDFVADRLTRLRLQAGVSARDMSLSIGQSPGYINKIESRQNLPSMTGFFIICEYLHIEPKDFFDQGQAAPQKLKELTEKAGLLSEPQLDALLRLIDSFVTQP